jgi:hypothetical protein
LIDLKAKTLADTFGRKQFEKAILRVPRVRAFSHNLGQNRRF